MSIVVISFDRFESTLIDDNVRVNSVIIIPMLLIETTFTCSLYTVHDFYLRANHARRRRSFISPNE